MSLAFPLRMIVTEACNWNTLCAVLERTYTVFSYFSKAPLRKNPSIEARKKLDQILAIFTLDFMKTLLQEFDDIKQESNLLKQMYISVENHVYQIEHAYCDIVNKITAYEASWFNVFALDVEASIQEFRSKYENLITEIKNIMQCISLVLTKAMLTSLKSSSSSSSSSPPIKKSK
jgi:hypothetical protein